MNNTARNILKAITFLFNGILVITGLLGFYTLRSSFDIFNLWLSIFFFVGGLISIAYTYLIGKEIKKLEQLRAPVKKIKK